MNMSDWAPPPSFGPDGSLPPVRSPLQQVPDVFFGRAQRTPGRSAVKKLTSAKSSNSPLFQDVERWIVSNAQSGEYLGPRHEKLARQSKKVYGGGLALTLFGPTFPVGVGLSAGTAAGQYLDSRREIIRLRRHTFWERTDPPAYLAPLSSTSLTVSYSSGVSETVASELVSTVGVESGIAAKIPGFGEASAKTRTELSAKLITTITRTERVELSRTYQISNPHSAATRVVAMWQPGNVLQVDRMRLKGDDLVLGDA